MDNVRKIGKLGITFLPHSGMIQTVISSTKEKQTMFLYVSKLLKMVVGISLKYFEKKFEVFAIGLFLATV